MQSSLLCEKNILRQLFHTYVILSQVGLHLNAIDYKIWGITQQRLYECCLNNVDELKQRRIDVWNGL